jgi:signal transduction histidine kinase
VFKKNGDLERLPLKDRPSANNIRTVFADRENNIWIGTDVAGLQRLRRKAFQTYTSKDGFRGDVFRSVAVSRAGRIWTAVHGGLDDFESGSPVRHLEPSEPLWWSVAADRNGDIWAATMPGLIARYEGDRLLFTNTVPEARTLAPRADGGMWVGSEFGLFQITANREVSKIAINGSDAKRSVKPVIETKGALWIGVSGEGIWKRFPGGAWEQIATPQGLTDLRVHTLYEDGEGLIWAGATFGGLHCLTEGRARDFQNADATLPSQITSIIEDGLGFMWLGSGNGIYRVKRADLLAFLDGDSTGFTVQRFDRSDGLGTPEMSENRQPTVAKAGDGKLWYASINGLSVVDPLEVRGDPNPPRVVIEEVAINGAKIQFTNGRLKVPPLSERLDIRYTGISLRSGARVRFKRRLIGLDKNWVEAGLERTASYYNLPPADYRFEVMAANADGVWSPAPANFSIRALPAYWQTLWFRTSLSALGIGLVAFAVLWRLRSAERAQAAQETFSQQLLESQEQERRRIAAELHDGLGQTLLILKQQARIAEKTPNVPQAAVDQLQKVTGNAQFAIEEVRGIVSALRPALLDRIGLTAALNSMLQQLSDSGSVKLTWTIDKMDGALPEGREIELYRIVQEALNNVVKHSNAATARVGLRRGAARWTLEIEDDGCGFDLIAAAKVLHSGGLGLNGLRERARILGAVLNIDSAPGEGTLVRLEGPAKTTA